MIHTDSQGNLASRSSNEDVVEQAVSRFPLAGLTAFVAGDLLKNAQAALNR